MDHHLAHRRAAGQRGAPPAAGRASRRWRKQDCPTREANWRRCLAKMIILFAGCQLLLPLLLLLPSSAKATPTNHSLASTQAPDAIIVAEAANISSPTSSPAPVKPPAKRLAVLCNSRCDCVLLEPASSNSTAPANASELATNKWPNQRQALERTLLAFSDDYSLDDGDSLEAADQEQLGNSIIGAAAAANGTTASGQSSQLGPAGRNQQPLEPNAGSGPRVANTSARVAAATAAARQAQLAQAGQPSSPLQLHQLHRPREPSGPQLYAQSLYSSQAPKLSYHAHKGYLGRAPAGPPSSAQVEPLLVPPGGHSGRHGRFFGRIQRPVDHTAPAASTAPPHRLLPLNRLDLSQQLRLKQSNLSAAGQQVVADWEREQPQFVSSIEQMLDSLATRDVQSLVLRNNELQFELWSELYALLAPSLRQQLFQLDLSHNALAKLGATFTGYIEHYLSVHNSWPQVANSSADSQPPPAPKIDAKLTRAHRYSLLSDGKLFTLIQRHQRLNLTSPGQATNLQPLLQQPVVLRALDLSHNKLKWLINDQFKTLKHVQAIRLDHNRIRYIHQHAFSGLDSLRYLNLNFNRLQVIYIEQFQTNYNLLALMLRSNNLAYLRGGSFASLSNLKRLDLSMNKLTILSQNALIGLESLELLNCSGNQFVHAPSASLHPLISLRQLDLSENMMAQLVPGAFFHLPVEELQLNENEQLVTIERGAFWDLPYLRHLSLSSNPMLMSVNSQAFVGTPALQTIEAENCPSLGATARQLFENVTMAATSRLLLHKTTTSAASAVQSSSLPSGDQTELAAKRLQQGIDLAAAVALTEPLSTGGINETFALPAGQPSAISDNIKQILELQSSRLKYVYYGATLCLLVVALKLVFKYTSTSHYMESRRRRRRVYEASSSSPSLNCSHDLDAKSNINNAEDEADFSLSMSSHHDYFQMCVQQPNNFVIGAAAARQQQQQLQTDNLPGPPCEPDSGQGARASDFEEEQRADSFAANLAGQISVITDGRQLTSPIRTSTCCPDCPAVSPSDCCIQTVQMEGTTSSQDEQRQPSQQQLIVDDLNQHATMHHHHQHSAPSQLNLIHSRPVTTGYDLGHADCDHFYQSLEPALQLADMTDDYANDMEGYF